MKSHHFFEIQEEPGLNVPVVHMEGELDLESESELVILVRDALASEECGIALDLRHVTNIDPMGILALVKVIQMARRKRKKVLFLDRTQPARSVLDACKVNRLVPIYPTVEHAREEFP